MQPKDLRKDVRLSQKDTPLFLNDDLFSHAKFSHGTFHCPLNCVVSFVLLKQCPRLGGLQTQMCGFSKLETDKPNVAVPTPSKGLLAASSTTEGRRTEAKSAPS